MPRRKVKIELIKDKQAQQVTLCKRRWGLFKKAKELAIMCEAQIGVIVFSAANKLAKYAYPSTLDEVIARRYQDLLPPLYLELVQENERVKRKYVEEELIVSQMEGLKLESLPMEQLNQLEERMLNTLRLVKEKKEVAQQEVVVPEERSQPEQVPVANARS